jgi:hypothetical protein
MIGKLAHEKETYSAYSALGALFFGNWGPTTSVQSRDKSADCPPNLNEWVGTLALAGARRQRQEFVSTTSHRGMFVRGKEQT